MPIVHDAGSDRLGESSDPLDDDSNGDGWASMLRQRIAREKKLAEDAISNSKVCGDNLSERVEEMYTLLLRMFDRHQEDEKKHTEEEMATRLLIEKLQYELDAERSSHEHSRRRVRNDTTIGENQIERLSAELKEALQRHAADLDLIKTREQEAASLRGAIKMYCEDIEGWRGIVKDQRMSIPCFAWN